MADLPFPVAGALRRQVLRCADVEGKVPRTLETLGPLAGRDVVLYDADGGWRARQIAASGARVVALSPDGGSGDLRRTLRSQLSSGAVTLAAGGSLATGLADRSADVVVSFFTAFRGGSDPELAEAERILRPGGRLLVVHDYARDDLSLALPDERNRELVAWSRRDGWFLRHGFRIHVIHALWTFPDIALLEETVQAVFDRSARALLAVLRRPRLSWKVVVYHRTREDDSVTPDTVAS